MVKTNPHKNPKYYFYIFAFSIGLSLFRHLPDYWAYLGFLLILPTGKYVFSPEKVTKW